MPPRSLIVFVLVASALHLVPHDALALALSGDPKSRRQVLQTTTTSATAAASMALVLPSYPTLAVADTAATTTSNLKSVAALNGPGGQTIPFPLVAFGLQIYPDDMAYKLTMTALEVGYRNFFASVLAGNQKGFARAVRDSGIPRDDLFICGSVVSNRVSGFENARKLTTRGWMDNMKAFDVGNIDYLDQIMLDYPGPDCDSIRGQWRAFEEMQQQKLTRTLSVSNFDATQLDCILQDTKIPPIVNQLPYSVAYHPGSVVAENAQRNILVQAWSPLGGSLGGRFNSRMKGVSANIGKKYGKSGVQVALRWIVQTGAAVCTQTKSKEHFVEDLDIFDFELSNEDMDTLGALA